MDLLILGVFGRLSGVCLVFLGCVVLNDTPRILLSRLFLEPGFVSQPLLYYVALALIVAGLIVCAVAVLGCWASWDTVSNWLMGSYIFLLILLLLAETSFGAVAALCPQIIGVTSDRDQMVAGLMNNYGVPGRSQYTAAVDLAQTLLECCGMQSGSDYDGSMWWKREQENSHNLRVPHSCCFLSNTDDETAFLNPKPVNSSLCQAKTNSRYQHGRHVKGCIDKLNQWFKEHVTIFLTIGLALVIVQLAALFCALVFCLRKRRLPEGSPNSTTESTNSTITSKKRKRSDKNLTPRPERKTAAVQISTIEDNGFPSGKIHQMGSEVKKNTIKSVNCSPKRLNLTDGFDEPRGRGSPTTLPLVLRNEHFHRGDECKPKQNLNSMKRNSPTVVKYNPRHNQFPNMYFAPHYESTPRNRVFYNDAEDYKLSGDLKSYFCKNEKHGVDNGIFEIQGVTNFYCGNYSQDESNHSYDRLLDDCFEPEEVPSHQPQFRQTAVDLAPWNTVGVPHLLKDPFETSKESETPAGNRLVKQVVRDIESGLYSGGRNQDRRKGTMEKIDISQTKRYWQEREMKSQERKLNSPRTVDYRTDYVEEGEKDGNVILVTVDGSDGIVLKASASDTLKFRKDKVKKSKPKRDVDEEDFTHRQENDLPDYEENWNRQIDRHHSPSVCNKKVHSTDTSQLKSHIPRIKPEMSHRFYNKEGKSLKSHTPKSGSFDRRTGRSNYFTLNSSRASGKYGNGRRRFSPDPRKSRANFFGNSGSYTLRCNLNPISNQKKRKFYLTPAPLYVGPLKLSKDDKIVYENFTAKKREFIRRKGNFSYGNDEAVMW
ncbi:hypothetical protein RUM44_007967 [Polyplax serrata]|uniref:Tetraspanin n=1 Tax=Polyplax serrata TaxID=468196 RepID=A0ABR1B921_POLSC